MTDRIVFLDIDGVLNSEYWFTVNQFTKATFRDLDPASIACLNEITRQTGARIVVSSTWRLTSDFPALVEHLKRQGVQAEIIGRTPRLHRPMVRGHEISAWMQCQIREPESICILDDDSDMAYLLPRLVLTDPLVGLVRQDVARAVEMLGATP